uniref:Uncharacterized protein n=1 Tax=Aegilops tauschii TaxID=37682 RepID=M8C516_AEGTA
MTKQGLQDGASQKAATAAPRANAASPLDPEARACRTERGKERASPPPALAGLCPLEQSNIVSSEILSIDFNPSCSYQLAFHLDDGWSGVLNVNTFSVSHLHCPPPAWLEGVDSVLHKRKATWLSTSSIYAVGSSSNNGIYALDFHPDTSSTCHVDYNEETKGSEENQPAENKFIPLSERVLSCAAHPLSHDIICGTEVLEQPQNRLRALQMPSRHPFYLFVFGQSGVFHHPLA